MIIKNLTSSLQGLRVAELVGGREFTIYLQGHASTELRDICVTETDKLGKTFLILGESTTSIVEDPEETSTETPVDEEVETTEESGDQPAQEDTTETSQESNVEEKFICDICGEEFGSARGLSAHKSRAHQE